MMWAEQLHTASGAGTAKCRRVDCCESCEVVGHTIRGSVILLKVNLCAPATKTVDTVKEGSVVPDDSDNDAVDSVDSG